MMQTEVAWKGIEDARAAVVRAQDEALAERDNALTMADSLRTARVEELKRVSEEEEQKLQAAQEKAVSKFTSDLKVLVAPIFALGFTKLVDEVSLLLSMKQQLALQDHDNYNPRALEPFNRLAKGI